MTHKQYVNKINKEINDAFKRKIPEPYMIFIVRGKDPIDDRVRKLYPTGKTVYRGVSSSDYYKSCFQKGSLNKTLAAMHEYDKKHKLKIVWVG
jgi:hypothetical protein